ncbi:site-specific DNA-methyltransferase [Methylocystis hirsuta]|uniref:site-specific DNA-methyltransferase (adenine-specific) n=1 Tax=Methylocystis hirsuta TaxID=369798 RepID=A0A3M9XLD2_9HYPH|nr:site-specific DNA-methyltransferase [Methylocystis hirsuta]RNJ48771.1 site-specific DNA-methyltransferase [Methylocystis hirsuta]
MLLDFYRSRKSVDDIRNGARARLARAGGEGRPNKLIAGDNLDVLRALRDDPSIAGKIKLVYIDPPFATKTHFRIGVDRVSTISSSKSDAVAYSDTLIDADFLNFLYERLVLLRDLMADDASIYLHIDGKIGHYVKVVMDDVFGRENFRNDIARIKCNPKNFDRKAFGNVKDVIYFYSKTDRPIWNDPRAPLEAADIETRFNKVDAQGRRYTTIPLHAPGETKGKTGEPWRGILPPAGRHWRSAPEVLEELDRQGLVEWSKNGVPRKRLYADGGRGRKVQDVWEFKDPQYPSYPTEKNLDMLKMIVEASSNEGDLVLDCFAGSGTTLVAAQALKRNWVGIDQSEHAIAAAKMRLASSDDLRPTSFEIATQTGITDPAAKVGWLPEAWEQFKEAA